MPCSVGGGFSLSSARTGKTTTRRNTHRNANALSMRFIEAFRPASAMDSQESTAQFRAPEYRSAPPLPCLRHPAPPQPFSSLPPHLPQRARALPSEVSPALPEPLVAQPLVPRKSRRELFSALRCMPANLWRLLLLPRRLPRAPLQSSRPAPPSLSESV